MKPKRTISEEKLFLYRGIDIEGRIWKAFRRKIFGRWKQKAEGWKKKIGSLKVFMKGLGMWVTKSKRERVPLRDIFRNKEVDVKKVLNSENRKESMSVLENEI